LSVKVEDLLNRLTSDPFWKEQYCADVKLVKYQHIYSGTFSEIWRGTYLCKNDHIEIIIKLIKFPDGRRAYDQESVGKEFRILDHAHKIYENNKLISVPKPIALFEQENVLAIEYIQGKTCFQELRNIKPWNRLGIKKIDNCVALIGKSLSLMQNSDKLDENSEPHSRSTDLELGVFMESALAGGMTPALAKRAEKTGKDLSNGWTSVKAVNSHGDFVPWNILVKNEGIAILDFSNYHLSDPEEDLSSMYTSLLGMKKFIWAGKMVERFRKKLLAGFENTPDPVRFLFWRIRTLLYFTGWLRHLKSASWIQRMDAGITRRLYEKDLNEVIKEAELLS